MKHGVVVKSLICGKGSEMRLPQRMNTTFYDNRKYILAEITICQEIHSLEQRGGTSGA